jgi:FkbM family methyltransferase
VGIGGGGGRRGLRRVLAAPLRRRHYRGLAGALRRYRTPGRDLWRYVSLRGSYPYRCRLRTPLGEVAPVLAGPDDIVTVHEIFCAGVYPVRPEARVIVDFGANIGISALYFLTEAPLSRVHLFEPNPALIGGLRENLAGFADRVVVNELAVSTHGGTTEFGVEPSGRYGGIGLAERTATIEVPCRPAAEVLAEVIAAEGAIDLLKIDVEGIETEILRSLDGAVLERIEAMAVETASPRNPFEGRFRMRREELVTHLIRLPRSAA